MVEHPSCSLDSFCLSSLKCWRKNCFWRIWRFLARLSNPRETITLNDILMISCDYSIDKPSSQERCPGQEDGTLAHALNSSTHPTNSEIWYVNWIIYNNLTQTVSHKLFTVTQTRHMLVARTAAKPHANLGLAATVLLPTQTRTVTCRVLVVKSIVQHDWSYLILFDDVWCTSSRRNARTWWFCFRFSRTFDFSHDRKCLRC